MNLRARLLFLFIPLTVCPLVFITIVTVFLLEKVGNGLIAHPYTIVALVFTLFMVAVMIFIIVSVSSSLAGPIKMLTVNVQKIANGDLETGVHCDASNINELEQLVTSIEKMKSELKRQQEMIRKEAADAVIGRIASHVAHDLASPLSSLQIAAEYFQGMEVSDPKMAQHTNLLEMAAKRLKTISKELLDYRKGKAPKKTIFSINAILDELVGEYTSQSHYDGVKFMKQYHPEALFIFGDRGKIQRAFGNLIKNAVEAMDKCGELTLATKLDEENVVVKVQDNGSGMEADVLKKVLEEGITHGKQDGNGIGVTVVRQAVAEHSGTISAVSEISVGTAFSVSLPIARSQQMDVAEKDDDTVVSFTLEMKRKEPVLVLDDDVGMLEQWRIKLEQHHVTAFLCTSYESFSEQKIPAELTKTAIVDYHFNNSELNGIEIIRRLKESGFDHLTLCTAEYWKASIKKAAKELGVALCPKPLPKITVRRCEEWRQ